MVDAHSLPSVLDARFRANPEYRPVAHADLPAAYREAFSAMAEDPSHFGVLISDRSDRGVLAVDCSTAELFHALATPGHLPEQVRAGVRAEQNRQILKMVFDGLLEIEQDGSFETGAHAHRALLGNAQRPESRTCTDDLSRDALRMGQCVPIQDPQTLAHWLYSYNTLPATPRSSTDLGSREAILRATGRSAGDPLRRSLESCYDHAETPGWHSWQSLERKLRYSESDGAAPAYKLYISPLPGSFGDVFRATVEVLLELRPPSFKTGRDLFGLLRPDKLMVYFDSRAELDRFQQRVEVRLAGCPPHGVPFAAWAGDTGLLYWGVDPPRTTAIPGWGRAASWRSWLTARLARAILNGRSWRGDDRADVEEPWIWALNRISFDGVDPATWSPDSLLWTDPHAARRVEEGAGG